MKKLHYTYEEFFDLMAQDFESDVIFYQKITELEYGQPFVFFDLVGSDDFHADNVVHMEKVKIMVQIYDNIDNRGQESIKKLMKSLRSRHNAKFEKVTAIPTLANMKVYTCYLEIFTDVLDWL